MHVIDPICYIGTDGGKTDLHVSMTELNGKVALITGASSGIGAAAAHALVKEGVKVVLVARRAERVEALAKSLGENAIPIIADVADVAAAEKVFGLIRDRFGGLHILFNNAGVGIATPFAESTPEQWRQQIDANIFGVLNYAHGAIPLLKGREGASIVNVSSVAGSRSFENWAVYTATKFAVKGFNDALRKELAAERIRVSSINPGHVYTEWGFNVPKDALREARDSIEALHADDIADALLYVVKQPPSVLVNDLEIRPTLQAQP